MIERSLEIVDDKGIPVIILDKNGISLLTPSQLSVFPPAQTGKAGLFLTTDGSNVSWAAASITNLTLNMGNVAHILTLGTTPNTGSGIIFPNTATDTVAMLGTANVFTANQTFTGQLLGPDSTPSLPAFAFASQPNTGIHHAAPNDVSIISAGSRVVAFGGANVYFLSTTPNLLLGATGDTILTRFAAANFQLGAAASATPVAQTLSVQDGVGTDIAGVNWTLRASRGTGAGAVGKIVLAASAAVLGTGTTLQTAVTHLTIGGGIGFFTATPVAQQVRAATLTNSIAASGTSETCPDFTNGSVYSTDYAALHAAVYWLAHAMVQHDTALRAYGLLT